MYILTHDEKELINLSYYNHLMVIQVPVTDSKWVDHWEIIGYHNYSDIKIFTLNFKTEYEAQQCMKHIINALANGSKLLKLDESYKRD